MGWKSTKGLSREKALELIMSRVINASDDDLGETLTSLGYGDDTDLPYYGYNFAVGYPDDEL